MLKTQKQGRNQITSREQYSCLAVLTWTRALAGELVPRGIRVNALALGLILETSFLATHTTKESTNYF